MPDQRKLFKQFYGRICQLDPVRGKALGKQVFNLMCSRTIMLRSYQEINHPQLQRSAYFSTYLCLFKDGKQYFLPGLLVLSMTYFNRARPIITLDKKGKILELNHAIVRSDSIVDTPLLRGWNENSSLDEVYHDIVDQLQGDPFVYEEKEEENNAEVVEEKPVLPAVVGTSCDVCMNIDFDPNIPYASLVKGKKLGAGAFATVYEVEYKGMLCAMKEWKRALSEYEQTALDREINIQKALRHPNCTRLYGVSRTDSGLPVLVMEKADGCLIDYTTKKKGPRLSNAEKCRIILEIAQGLEYIHSLNCVHRDIKLDNILMKDGHPKISDFGLSRTVKGDVSMTMTFCGSPAFMAPELIMGKRATNKVDVYSFGCIVNEIITERMCYSDIHIRNQTDFFARIRRGLHPTIFPDTPNEVKVLLNECYKNYRFRPDMKTIVEMIQMWQPAEW